MANSKPENLKKTSTHKVKSIKNVDIKKSTDNKPNGFKFLISTEQIIKHFSEKIDGYTIQEVMEEYRHVNEGFIKAMDLLMFIFGTMQVNEDDINYLKSIEYYYHNRKLIRKDTRFFDVDVFKNILEATLSDTIEKAKKFFGNSVESWDEAANKYRSLAFKISDLYYKNLIRQVDNLLSNLKDLYADFYNENNEFKNWFTFSDILTEAQDYADLVERKKFINRIIVDCKEFCLKQEYFKVNKEDELDFLRKCQELIDLIDFQIQNDIPANPFDVTNVISNNAVEQDQSVPKIPLPETDITLNRQFLALYYLLNEVDKEAFARNKSEIARFIQLLTGKNYDNIYKLTKNPIKDPSERTSKKYQTDIQFVKETFLKLGLDKIARQIENDNLIG